MVVDPGGKDVVQKLQEALDGGDFHMSVAVSEEPEGKGATGGHVPAMSSGGRVLKPGITFTGEEGPELVWNK
jgi:hypothetical protein